MSKEMVQLRMLKFIDFHFLKKIENDSSYWHLSSQNKRFTDEELLLYLKNSNLPIEQTGQIRFVIEAENTTVGFIDLYEYDPIHQRAGVGIIIDEFYRRKGYAKESLRNLIEFSKSSLKLNQLFACVDELNIASQHVFEQLGFIKTGLKKKWIIKNGKWLDAIDYQLLFD